MANPQKKPALQAGIRYDNSNRTALLSSANVESPEFKADWLRLGTPYQFTVFDASGNQQDYCIAEKVMRFADYKSFVLPALDAAIKDKTTVKQRIAEALRDTWFPIFALKDIFKAAIDTERPVQYFAIISIASMLRYFDQINPKFVCMQGHNWHDRVDALAENTIVLNKNLKQIYPVIAQSPAPPNHPAP